MKKILILLVVAVLATNFAFAQEANGGTDGQRSSETNVGRTSSDGANSGVTIERFNAEINIGFPVHWTNGQHSFQITNPNGADPAEVDDIYLDKTVTATTAIGVGIIFNFNNKAGIVLETDFFYSAELAGVSDPTSDTISLSGANVFVGPLFYLYNNNVFRIPLAIGLHMYTFSDELWIPQLHSGSWVSRDELQFGVGGSIAFQFHFESGIYIFSRTSVIIDFVRMHSIEGPFSLGLMEDEVDKANGTKVTRKDHVDLFNFLSWNIKPTVGVGIRF